MCKLSRSAASERHSNSAALYRLEQQWSSPCSTSHDFFKDPAISWLRTELQISLQRVRNVWFRRTAPPPCLGIQLSWPVMFNLAYLKMFLGVHSHHARFLQGPKSGSSLQRDSSPWFRPLLKLRLLSVGSQLCWSFIQDVLAEKISREYVLP